MLERPLAPPARPNRAAGAVWLVAAVAVLLSVSGCDEQPTAGSIPDTAQAHQDGSPPLPPDSAAPLPDARPPNDTVAPPPKPSLRIAVISDLNGSYGSTTYGAAVHAAIEELTTRIKPDLVLNAGDMVAGQQAGLDYEAMWAGFHAAVTDPLAAANIPMVITPGNHDASGYASFAGERAIFIEQWQTPSRKPKVTYRDDADYPLRYSFVFGGVLFIALDATTVGPLSADQRSWVDQQLATAEQSLRIVFGHLSIRSVTVGRETEILDDLELEQMLAKHNVALYVAGHQHGYYPGAAAGVRQITVGCLGSGPRALIGTSDATPLSMVLIEIVQGQISSVEAYRSTAFDQVVSRSSLPTALTYDGKTLTRDDLAGL